MKTDWIAGLLGPWSAELTLGSIFLRLAVSMANVLKGPPDVTGVTEKVIETITKVDDKGTPVAQPFTEIRRNNVYQITARVGKIGIQILTITVEDWGEVKNIDLNMDL